ncbi:MAG: hypothetical protein ABMA13_13180 [Chthoniobacteraceae bacterium]
MKQVNVILLTVAVSIAFAMSTYSQDAFNETLNFNDNQIPFGWIIFTDSTHSGTDAGVANMRFEARPSDTFARLARAKAVPADTEKLRFSYRQTISEGLQKMSAGVSIRVAGGRTFVMMLGRNDAGTFVRVGLDVSTTQEVPLASIQPGTYDVVTEFKRESVSIFVTPIGGSSVLNVSPPVTGLDPATVTEVSLLSGTAAESIAWIDEVTMTAIPPLRAVTETATEIKQNSAKLNGTVGTGGTDSTVYFQYGLTESLGLETTQKTVPGNGSGRFSEVVTGLTGKNYFYRLVVTQAGTAVLGETKPFTVNSKPRMKNDKCFFNPFKPLTMRPMVNDFDDDAFTITRVIFRPTPQQFPASKAKARIVGTDTIQLTPDLRSQSETITYEVTDTAGNTAKAKIKMFRLARVQGASQGFLNRGNSPATRDHSNARFQLSNGNGSDTRPVTGQFGWQGLVFALKTQFHLDGGKVIAKGVRSKGKLKPTSSLSERGVDTEIVVDLELSYGASLEVEPATENPEDEPDDLEADLMAIEEITGTLVEVSSSSGGLAERAVQASGDVGTFTLVRAETLRTNEDNGYYTGAVDVSATSAAAALRDDPAAALSSRFGFISMQILSRNRGRSFGRMDFNAFASPLAKRLAALRFALFNQFQQNEQLFGFVRLNKPSALGARSGTTSIHGDLDWVRQPDVGDPSNLASTTMMEPYRVDRATGFPVGFESGNARVRLTAPGIGEGGSGEIVVTVKLGAGGKLLVPNPNPFAVRLRPGVAEFDPARRQKATFKNGLFAGKASPFPNDFGREADLTGVFHTPAPGNVSDSSYGTGALKFIVGETTIRGTVRIEPLP